MELEPEYGLSPEDQQTKRMRRSNPGSKGAAAASAVATASGNKAAGGTTPAPQVAQLTGQLLPGQHQQHGQEPLSLKPGSSSTYEEHRAGAPSSTWGVLHSLGTAGEAPPQPTSLLGLQRQLLGAAATHHLQRLVGQLLEAEGVADPGAWVGVLTRLACDAAALVLPPAMVNNGVLDPRHYIKVGARREGRGKRERMGRDAGLDFGWRWRGAGQRSGSLGGRVGWLRTWHAGHWRSSHDHFALLWMCE
eukprot:1156319-Pelagomonas_calceolata.AAC.26